MNGGRRKFRSSALFSLFLLCLLSTPASAGKIALSGGGSYAAPVDADGSIQPDWGGQGGFAWIIPIGSRVQLDWGNTFLVRAFQTAGGEPTYRFSSKLVESSFGIRVRFYKGFSFGGGAYGALMLGQLAYEVSGSKSEISYSRTNDYGFFASARWGGFLSERGFFDLRYSQGVANVGALQRAAYQEFRLSLGWILNK